MPSRKFADLVDQEVALAEEIAKSTEIAKGIEKQREAVQEKIDAEKHRIGLELQSGKQDAIEALKAGNPPPFLPSEDSEGLRKLRELLTLCEQTHEEYEAEIFKDRERLGEIRKAQLREAWADARVELYNAIRNLERTALANFQRVKTIMWSEGVQPDEKLVMEWRSQGRSVEDQTGGVAGDSAGWAIRTGGSRWRKEAGNLEAAKKWFERLKKESIG